MSEPGDVGRGLRTKVAEEIQVLLLRRRSNPTRLAKSLGWSQSYMSRRMVGDSPFDLDDLEAIAAALDVPITDLFPTRKGVTGQYPVPGHAVVEHPIVRPVKIPGLPLAAGARRTAPTGR